MWLAWNHSKHGVGFASVVRDDHDRGRMIVRFRDAESAEVFKRITGEETLPVLKTGSDYLYRVYVRRAVLLAFLRAIGADLGYGNFKDSVARAVGNTKRGRNLLEALHAVWSIGRDFQSAVFRADRGKPKLRGILPVEVDTEAE